MPDKGKKIPDKYRTNLAIAIKWLTKKPCLTLKLVVRGLKIKLVALACLPN